MKTLFSILLFALFSLNACSQANSYSGVVVQKDSQQSDLYWKAKLTPEQYFVLRENGTERPYSGEFLFHQEAGVYTCAACNSPLFSSDMKFESHCGWPSFDKELGKGRIIQREDKSHGMERIEISCANCGGHLGHLFSDGPTETGQRYCVNSVSLSFEPKVKGANSTNDTLTLGAGCFWCVEAVFSELKGVLSATSGYSGGIVPNPDYDLVSEGNSGYVEVVQVVFDTSQLSLSKLLEVYFSAHNPTTINQQGADKGPQYRSVIFYHRLQQRQLAENWIQRLNQQNVFQSPIVTKVEPVKNFYTAENYHQQYYKKNKSEPYCRLVIQPKLDKLHKAFSNELK